MNTEDVNHELYWRKIAFTFACDLVFWAFCNSPRGNSSSHAERGAQLQSMSEQIAGIGHVIRDQVPADSLDACATPFAVLQDVIGVLMTAHPEATPDDLSSELDDLARMTHAKPPPASDGTA